MPTNVEVPALGESVQEVVLLKWHRKDGDAVKPAEPLCELETDKANVDLPAPVGGVLRRLKKEGETLRIGEAIATIDESGTPAKAAPAPPPAPKAELTLKDLRPSVRRLVEEHEIDLDELSAALPSGQISREDVQRFLEARKPAEKPAPQAPAPEPEAPAPPAPAPAPAAPVDGVRRVPLSKIRRKIAERLVDAQNTAAILHTYNEIDLQKVLDLRTQYKEKFEQKHGVGLGLMSFFARACVLALKEFSSVNAFIEGSDVVYHDHVHLGLAVSTDRGLVVPVLKNVEQMSFAKIENEIKRLANSAREGKLGLEELSGGTFTITNGGIFGSLLSAPILNPPQSAILGMHVIKKRPVVVDDQIVVRPMMYVVLGYDHRLIDGRESVSFLVRIKEYLEEPARLMLEA